MTAYYDVETGAQRTVY